MINFNVKKIKPFGDSREINAFIIEPPYQDLSIIKGINNMEELDLFIDWLNELIKRDISDYSEAGFIIYQPFFWGSKKSKIAEIVNEKELIGCQEFDTKEFLEVCYAWRDFLKTHSKD